MLFSKNVIKNYNRGIYNIVEFVDLIRNAVNVHGECAVEVSKSVKIETGFCIIPQQISVKTIPQEKLDEYSKWLDEN